MKTLIVYYSYSGNTRKIADTILKRLGGDAAEIETAAPYPADYNEVVDQGQKEVNQGYMPAIKPLVKDPAAYDTVVLGTPVWWYTFAPAVKTFLAQNDLSGKTVYPFITNGGWIGHTVQDIENAIPNAAVKEAVNIRFNGSDLSVSVSEIENWIAKIEAS